MAITEDQTEVIAFLTSPAAHDDAAVERIETHASVVFLAGARAWKLKRAVRYDYLDFSTVERRKAMCEAELRVNRRTAPDLYRGIVAVTREADGALAVGGPGTPVEWLIEMVRFDQDELFDRRASRGALDEALMPALGTAIARFHLDAARRLDRGGRAAMAWVIDGNAAGFAEEGGDILDAATCARVTGEARAALERNGALLDARRDAGFVRHCHGDLHLRNIVTLDGRPTLFDGIEFNDDIACIDTLYDLAFLLMDLWRRELPRHANAIWNGYLTETVDLGGIPLLPLFLSCRAAVRAKTSVTAARLQSDPQRRRELQERAREYLSLAERLLHPPAPCLVGVGGLSGTGKSTLSRDLAPLLGAVPGAVVSRSDVIRKRLCGVDVTTHLGPEAYTADISRRVYAAVLERADLAVRGGQSVVADAVFAGAADREALEQLAKHAGVPFAGVWLAAPASQLISRAASRVSDASDADAEVIRHQLARDTGAITWHRVDASSTPSRVLTDVMVLLDERLKTAVSGAA